MSSFLRLTHGHLLSYLVISDMLWKLRQKKTANTILTKQIPACKKTSSVMDQNHCGQYHSCKWASLVLPGHPWDACDCKCDLRDLWPQGQRSNTTLCKPMWPSLCPYFHTQWFQSLFFTSWFSCTWKPLFFAVVYFHFCIITARFTLSWDLCYLERFIRIHFSPCIDNKFHMVSLVPMREEGYYIIDAKD